MTEALGIGASGEPVLVFGGLYGNRHATEAVLEEGRRRGIPPDATVCTGDVVAYCGEPAATVDIVRRSGIHVVMGNCEEALATDADDCGCGFAPGSVCDELSARWFELCRAALDADAKAWMAALPRRLDFTLEGRHFAVVHATPGSMSRHVFPSHPLSDKREEIRRAGSDAVVCGHSGLPFSQVIDGRLWHNAGVAGLPPNDGTPRVWASVIAAVDGGIRVEHVPIAYDHSAAARATRAAGFPEAYAAALETGLWPSLDVMPESERRRTGEAVHPRRLFWPH